MTRKKLLLMIESLLCILVAGLLVAAAVSLYTDGGGARAEWGVFGRYTRERAGAKLMPVLPFFAAVLLVAAAARIAGIRDENVDKPIGKDQLRDSDHIRDKAVNKQADRKTVVLRAAILVIALILLIAGIMNGGAGDVLAKGLTICAECIGLG